jgi:hypothetical protein
MMLHCSGVGIGRCSHARQDSSEVHCSSNCRRTNRFQPVCNRASCAARGAKASAQERRSCCDAEGAPARSSASLPGRWINRRRRVAVAIQSGLGPIIAPQLDRVLPSFGAVAATHVISRTEVLASPADAFRVSRTNRKLAFHDVWYTVDPRPTGTSRCWYTHSRTPMQCSQSLSVGTGVGSVGRAIIQ